MRGLRRGVLAFAMAASLTIGGAGIASAHHNFEPPIDPDDLCAPEQGARHFGQTVSFLAKMGKVDATYNPGVHPGFTVCLDRVDIEK